ncbi:MAG TPA: hypothetical protein VK821_15990, partial [Dehalococcoidia bacterium]|nr:hypothetical protein [Dehalococcoidia bacterium]
LDASGAATDLISFYTSAMATLGWTPPTQPAFPGPSGFLPSTSSQSSSAVFCQSQSGPSLAVSAMPMANGSLDVRLAFETTAAGFSSACGGPRGPLVTPTLPLGQGLLPRLPAPAGVTVQQQSGGSIGGPGRSSSDASATTDISPLGLEALYEQELVSAGWTRTGGDGAGGLAWSTWSIPDQNDWQGFLYARLGPGDMQRSLHVEVASASQQTSPGVYYGGSAFAYPYPTSGSVGSCTSLVLSPGEVCENGVALPLATATPVPTPTGSGH